MAYPKFVPTLLQSLARPFRRFDDKPRRCHHLCRVKPQLEALESRIVPSTYTMPLKNDTGLNPAQESIYVLGFSAVSQMALQSNGQFASLASGPATGSIQSYEVGTAPGDIQKITLDSATPLIGARLYFIVVPDGQAPPTFSYSGNGTKVSEPNPPPDNPHPYGIVEITQPIGGGLPTLDVESVDGFIFPLTLTLNNNLGQVGQPGRQTGDSTPNPTINLQGILTAYQSFINHQIAIGTPNAASYQDLLFGPNKTIDSLGGIANPGKHLALANSTARIP